MKVHLNAAQSGQTQEGELSLNFLKKYIGYCKRYISLFLFKFQITSINFLNFHVVVSGTPESRL